MSSSGSGPESLSPRFSVLTTVQDPLLPAFEDTTASVLGQELGDWEWILVDCSWSPAIRERLRELAAEDSRVRVHVPETDGGRVAAAQLALEHASGEFVVQVDPGDALTTRALTRLWEIIDANPAVDYLYGDHDRLSVDSSTRSRLRKPDWSPERLRHHDYVVRPSAMRRQLTLEVGGFRREYAGSHDHDLALRVTERARTVAHIPDVLYHARQDPDASVGDVVAQPVAREAGVRAVQDHLGRVRIHATAGLGRVPGTYTLHREPDLTTPTSIVVPTIGTSGEVGGAARIMVVETLLSVLKTTAHRALEVIVVYDTPTPAPVLEELQSLSTVTTPVRLVEFTEPFSFSRKCNVGALRASGQNLVFLNDDMEAVSDGVVEHLVAPLREAGVGATGAKLLFEDGRIQHAGLVYGSGSVAHSHYEMEGAAQGAYRDLWINREVSALTGACLAVRRDVFDEVGGFSEALPINYNDVDFSHKVRRTGRRLVWLHDVVLHHYESATRSTTVHDWEDELIRRRWGDYRTLHERYTTSPHRAARVQTPDRPDAES